MTIEDLKTRLRHRIQTQGPISIADYMASCLTDPTAGYYTTRDPFGQKGDFITAPEVSQMFGELIGAFFLQAYERMGSPDHFQLVELGPGRGTLMADLLRMASLRPKFINAANLTLVEMSLKLQKIQTKTLSKSPLRPGFAEQFDQVADGPVLLIANEFFDALPIHQFVKTPNGWVERMVGLNETGDLAFGLGTGRLSDRDIPATALGAADGAILETQPASNAIAEAIGHRIKEHGGAALFIDYGYLKSAPGDTLQAIRKHAFDDVLANPGKADITAHVNFGALASACHQAGSIFCPPLEQGEFLLRLGLLERAGVLGNGKSHKQQETIRNDVERLAAPDKMGQLFKVLAVSDTSAPLAPFDPATQGKQ
ncbi:class I SAM-dependent methyltransferase [Roseibium algae]|uniref:Class I SAM-dependent methyltransferase n=1 Tax=Roseibium algae TaxID=3123038 RepID=A0ABU8TFG3_9HYPH